MSWLIWKRKVYQVIYFDKYLKDPKILESIQIKIYEEATNKIYNRYIIKTISGKYSLTIEEGI